MVLSLFIYIFVYCCLPCCGVYCYKQLKQYLKSHTFFVCLVVLYRLARDAWFSDPSASGISSLSSSPYTWNLDWLYHQSFHRLLPSSRTYPSLGWVQAFVHAAPWCIKHSRDHPYSGLPCLGSNRSCLKIDICLFHIPQAVYVSVQ